MKKLNYDLAVEALNKVEGFNPRDYALNIAPEGSKEQELYLDVSHRWLWFRLKNPEGAVRKSFIKLDEKVAIVEARVYTHRDDPDDAYVASAIAQRYYDQSTTYGIRYAECCETAAEGRALARAGFGTQFAHEKTEGLEENSPVDTPVKVTTQKNGDTATTKKSM